MANVLVLHGPNLNRLGTREPGTYGAATLADINQRISSISQASGVEEPLLRAIVAASDKLTPEQKANRSAEVMTEQDFGASGRVDNYSAAEIGRILGVEALILGTVNRMEISDKGGIKVGPVTLSGVQVDVEYTGRMVDTETAEILMSFKGVGRETDTGLSVSQLHGVSLGSSAFSNSALGKSINAANKDFVDNIIENVPDLSAAREAIKVIEGRVLELVGDRLVINIGRSSNLQKGQRGSLIQLIEVSGLDEPMTVPIGEVAVYHLEDNAAILDVLNSEEPPQPGFIVRF